MTGACSSTHGDGDGDEDGYESGPDVRIGTVLDDKYQIESVLGVGGMGVVYAARNLRIGRRVAIKFLLPEYARSAHVLKRFENEARAAGSLEHENIAAVLDVGQASDGSRFLVMEFLQGEDCEQLLSRDGPLPAARAVNIAVQVCRGLDAAHRVGIVHRDLKPSNLFLTKRGDGTDLVKILDFGIAKLQQPASATSATATGLAMGTAHYMSPEQARGDKALDHRTDLYTLGVILYEFLSGRKPHEGDTYLRVVNSILHTVPAPLATLRQGLPAALPAVVDKAMRTDPARRFQSAAELGDSLLPFTGASVPPRHALGSAEPTEPDRSATRPSPGDTGPGASETSPPLSRSRLTPPAASASNRARWVVLTALVAAAVLAALYAHWRTVRADSMTERAPATSQPSSVESPPSGESPALSAHPVVSPELSAQLPDLVDPGGPTQDSRDGRRRAVVPDATRRRAEPPQVSVVSSTATATILPPSVPSAGVVDIDPDPNF